MSEYSPAYMRKGGIDPEKYLDLFFSNNYTPYNIKNNKLEKLSKEFLLEQNENLNIIWKDEKNEIVE